MAIREDLVASATQFLQDPSVAGSSLDNRVSFLRAKNLTQEEIDAALARAGVGAPPTYPQAAPFTAPPQQFFQPYQQYAYPPPPPPVPRRDWRDWFIMATVMGGVGYGVYAIAQRYVLPLIAPPTPERIEQDKRTIDEQFDKAFALMDQLTKDTEALKAAEQERTERLDGALSELEAALASIKSANRRRDEEAQRIREDIYALRDSIPKAMDAQKNLVDSRLKEVNGELTSLKTLMTQRMNAASSSSASTGSYLRPTSGNAGQNASSVTSKANTSGSENTTVETSSTGVEFAKQSGQGRASPFGGAAAARSIPAWQLAMANTGSSVSAAAGTGNSDAQDEAAGAST